MNQPVKSKFHEAIVQYNESNRGHPQYELWMNYALGTNERGKQTVGTLRNFMPNLRGRRHLDIGCGYGGTCIAMAEQGAASVGIDLDDQLLEFSRINLADHPGLEAEFQRIDIMDAQKLAGLERFDIITCDNVIEHVAVPEKLIAHIRRLLKDSGVVYVTIPNAFSIGQIYADCHYGLFGISLLDPWDAEDYLRGSLGHPNYDVSFYYLYDVYQGLFKKYGLETRLLNSLAGGPEDIELIWGKGEKIKDDFYASILRTAVPEAISIKLSKVIEVYVEGLRSGINHYRALANGQEKSRLGARLLRDYREELWYVIVASQAKTIFPYEQVYIARRIFNGAMRRAKKALAR